MVLFQIHKWGHNNPLITYFEMVRIERAAAKQVAYDCGYYRSFAYETFNVWEHMMDSKLVSGGNKTTRNKESISYVDKIEAKHRGYLYYIYHYAIHTYGARSICIVLTTGISLKSDAPAENRMSIYIKRSN